MAKYINRFSVVPKELFRLGNGPTVSLRDRAVKKVGSYDILSETGKVKPKAITSPETYRSPNGASLRPNTPTVQDLVDNFSGASVVVYAIPQELNAKINDFLKTNGKLLTKAEWKTKYPKATETS
ncbi:hypothetical protein DV738_g364, partial [Chaetothyriales sp. CBS 135597]